MAQQRYYAHEWKPVRGRATEASSGGGCFECNICLDYAREPIVTLCGHLYCWPCIYRWLHVQSASLASDEHPQCPVCKAHICHTAMVPLYGRGHDAAPQGEPFPPRPSPGGAAQALSAASGPRPGAQRLPYRNPYQARNYSDLFEGYHDGDTGPPPALVGMFGGLVYAAYPSNASSYSLPGRAATPRLRRHEMHAYNSLNRVSIFMFCCLLLCLLVF